VAVPLGQLSGIGQQLARGGPAAQGREKLACLPVTELEFSRRGSYFNVPAKIVSQLFPASPKPACPRGIFAGQVTDNRNPSSGLSNQASYTYDFLGRLTGASGPNFQHPPTDCPTDFCYDALGNMTTKDGQALCYENAAKPHQVTKVCTGTCSGSCSSVTHDANGNRGSKGGGTQNYYYDPDDHLDTVAVSGQPVDFVYDYTGQRVAKVVNNGASVTRYFSPGVEVTDGWLTKYYYAGGLLVASQRVWGGQLAPPPRSGWV